MRIVPRALLISVLLLAVPVPAQEFWQKKPYSQWSENECRKLLENSPWAKQHIIASAELRELSQPANSPARENAPRITYTAQLRSAAPLRQAMVRIEQLAAGYDELASDAKSKFDQQARQFLSAQPDGIIVYVEYSSNVQQNVINIQQYWERVTLARARNEVFLYGESGQRIEPIQLTRKGTAFQFVFPRSVNGQPVVTDATKELRFEFQHALAGNAPNPNSVVQSSGTPRRVFITFKVPPMKVNGQLQY